MLTKMSKEMPLPIPFSEIFLPSHTVNMVPAVRVSVIKDKLKKSVLATHPRHEPSWLYRKLE
jgi:hypothetical protein